MKPDSESDDCAAPPRMDPAKVDAIIQKVTALKNKPFEELNARYRAGKIEANFSTFNPGKAHSCHGRGYLGQYLVVVPETRVVAIRMRQFAQDTETEIHRRYFTDFVELADQLVVRR